MTTQPPDVIVVGAGPAGSTAAAVLAQAGRRVVLVDRSTFPRDKTCGDAIQAGAIDLLRQIGWKGTLDPSHFTRITDWSIEAPSRTAAAAELNTHGHDPYIARRIDFDQLVYQQAINSGAEFCHAQVTAPIREGARVVGVVVKFHGEKETRELRAPLVVAADGATSVIAREMIGGLNQPVHWAVAIRGYAKLTTPLTGRCEFYFPKAVLPGYAWLFPTGRTSANIGVGMRLDRYQRQPYSLKELLERFVSLLGDRMEPDSLHAVKSWQIPFGSQRFARAFEGCILVGDAGRFVDPLLGAGIYFGMRTGYLAAQVINATVRAGKPLTEGLEAFDTSWRNEIGFALRRATLVQKLVISYPRALNLVLGIASLNPTLGRQVVIALSGEKI